MHQGPTRRSGPALRALAGPRPEASSLGKAGAEADGLGRRRGRREARIAHPLQDGAVEGVDDEQEALRGANGVADFEALGGGLAIDSGLHNEDHPKACRANSNTHFQLSNEKLFTPKGGPCGRSTVPMHQPFGYRRGRANGKPRPCGRGPEASRLTP